MPDPTLFFVMLGALGTTLVVALAFAYLASRERRPELSWWAAGWCVYVVRLAFQVLDKGIGPGDGLFLGEQAATLASSWLLLAGTFRWRGRAVPLRWLLPTGAAVVWLPVAAALDASFLLATVPPYLVVAALYARIGLLFLRAGGGRGLGRHVAGWVFLLWALHKADYPLLRPIEGIAPWGYLLALVLTLAAAIAVIIVYFDDARATARESETRFRLLADNAQDVVYRFRTSPALALEYVSPSITALAGVTPAELTGNPDRFRALLHPDDREATMGRSRSVEETQDDAREGLVRVVRPDGGVVWVEFRSTRLRDAEGRVAAIEGIARDVTARVRAESELRALHDRLEDLVAARTQALGEANERLRSEVRRREEAEAERRRIGAHIAQTQRLESLGVLAGGVAHDYNNLLLSILGNAEVARSELPRDARTARESLADIETAANRAAELTRQLLAYAGKGQSVVQRLDLSAVVGSVRELVATASARGANVAWELADDLPPVAADEGQLRQVALGLVTNAAEALEEKGGTVHIRTYARDLDAAALDGAVGSEAPRAGRYVVLEVEDDGEGIPAENRERVFEPFFTTRFPGRGLGLSAALGIARSHGGAILLDSQEGEGTRCRFLLPAVEAAPAPTRRDPAPTRRDPAPAPRDPAPAMDGATPTAGPDDGDAAPTDAGPTGAGRAVLVADDEDAILRLVRRVLERSGYEVVTVDDGDEAIARFRERPGAFAAALLDLEMARVGGEEAAAAIRRVRPDLPILFSSGYVAEDVAGRVGGRERTRFVRKPYRPRDLAAALADVIAAPPRRSA